MSHGAKKRPVKKVSKSAAGSKKKSAKKRAEKKKAVKKKAVKKKAVKKKAVASKMPELVLNGSLNIKSVAALKDRLAVVLADKGPIIIDAAHVESADTAGLQLLCAFANSARKQSRELTWKQPSNALRELSELLDLDHHLDFDAQGGNDTPKEGAVVLCPVF